ncbi:MAG: helix-turn-helix domain-containing protein [Desulfatiglandaceae bacterium]
MKMLKNGEYTIADISLKVGLSQKTIRDYEKWGLIKPKRHPMTNNRIFSDFELEQIQQIARLLHGKGFTLSCLRTLLQMAPCWNIFNCELKKECPAFEFYDNPCYEIRREKGTLCSGHCEQCAVYINRDTKGEKVLQRPDPIPA